MDSPPDPSLDQVIVDDAEEARDLDMVQGRGPRKSQNCDVGCSVYVGVDATWYLPTLVGCSTSDSRYVEVHYSVDVSGCDMMEC